LLLAPAISRTADLVSWLQADASAANAGFGMAPTKDTAAMPHRAAI